MNKVLVVDDDKNFLTNIGHFLTSKGYEPVLAVDGTEALVKYEETSPQVILLDILLPKLNGFEVCKKIRQAGEHVPIILTSAIYKKPEIQNEARAKYGASDYLVKPIDPEDLAARLAMFSKVADPAERSERMVRPTPEPAPSQSPDDGGRKEVATDAVHDDPERELVPNGDKAPAPQNDGEPVPREGEVRKGTVIRLIRGLLREKACGVLEILSGKEKRLIFILDGRPVFASSFNFTDKYTVESIVKILKGCITLTDGTYFFSDGMDFLDYVPIFDLPFPF